MSGFVSAAFDDFKVLSLASFATVDGLWFDNAGDTVLTGGKLQMNEVGAGRSLEKHAIRRGFRGSKYILEYDHSLVLNQITGALLHYQDPENFMAVTFTKGLSNTTPKLVRRKDGVLSTIATGSAFSMSNGDRARCAIHDDRN